jgi:polysaccharide deacetylase family protein (PEP-CTERM system associated)
MDTTLRILERRNVKATFFVLGWVADHHPKVVRDIVSAGHEIGCHSYSHRLVYHLSPSEFRKDTVRAMQAIQNACGVRPRLYRAPSYSIVGKSLWALEILAELGFTHDSSIYPIAHDRYGIPGSARRSHLIRTGTRPIVEVPAATVELSGRVLPIGGGGYLRLLPYRYISAGIRRVNEHEGAPTCIYFHPWELDPDQPRLALGLISRLRTYGGLTGMRAKVEHLLDDFHFSKLSTVYPGQRDWVEAKPATGVDVKGKESRVAAGD